MTMNALGNLGQDPVVKRFESGTIKATFSVADRIPRKKEGEDTEWRNVEVWGKTAEYVENYLRQGSLVYVEGDLLTNKYEDKEGNKRQNVFIKANLVLNLTKREQEAVTSEEETTTTTTAKKTTASAKPADVEDDIPF